MPKAYIQQTACISATPTFDGATDHRSEPQSQDGRLQAVEPDYKSIITDAGRRRRMGRLIRMGLATALRVCPKGSRPGAILTATGMGALTDTKKFLDGFAAGDAALCNPAAFIQSTGNTLGGTIAQALDSHSTNLTYCHGGFSFESALTDALMLLGSEETDQDNWLGSGQDADKTTDKTGLVVAADEITDTEYDVMRRMGFWRGGQLMGEGATAFLIGTMPGEGGTAINCIEDVRTLRGPVDTQELSDTAMELLGGDATTPLLLLRGIDCDKETADALTNALARKTAEVETDDYRRYCGQWATSSAYGVWRADQMLKKRAEEGRRARAIVYSEYRKNDYSLIMLTQGVGGGQEQQA